MCFPLKGPVNPLIYRLKYFLGHPRGAGTRSRDGTYIDKLYKNCCICMGRSVLTCCGNGVLNHFLISDDGAVLATRMTAVDSCCRC